MQIGEKIRLMRKRRRFTKKELAEKAGISSYYVNKLEEGKSNPSIEIVDKLAKALNINIDYFTRGILDDSYFLKLNNKPVFSILVFDDTLSPTKPTNLYWELQAPSIRLSRYELLKNIIKTKDWQIRPTGENIVYLSRIISKIIAKKEIETIVGLTPHTGIIAGALSAVLYEKKESESMAVIIPTMIKGELIFRKENFQPGLRVMLLEEIAKQTDRFLQAANEIKRHRGEIIIGVTIIDLLDRKERKHLQESLPEYEFIFSEKDIVSVLENIEGETS